jgi:hypothetical protein
MSELLGTRFQTSDVSGIGSQNCRNMPLDVPAANATVGFNDLPVAKAELVPAELPTTLKSEAPIEEAVDVPLAWPVIAYKEPPTPETLETPLAEPTA